jgi:hypothetical protein
MYECNFFRRILFVNGLHIQAQVGGGFRSESTLSVDSSQSPTLSKLAGELIMAQCFTDHRATPVLTVQNAQSRIYEA